MVSTSTALLMKMQITHVYVTMFGNLRRVFLPFLTNLNGTLHTESKKGAIWHIFLIIHVFPPFWHIFLSFHVLLPFFHITFQMELDSEALPSCKTHTTRIELVPLRRLPLFAAPGRKSAELILRICYYFFCSKPSQHNYKPCHRPPHHGLSIRLKVSISHFC